MKSKTGVSIVASEASRGVGFMVFRAQGLGYETEGPLKQEHRAYVGTMWVRYVEMEK